LLNSIKFLYPEPEIFIKYKKTLDKFTGKLYLIKRVGKESGLAQKYNIG
jgi:hypothetical protein